MNKKTIWILLIFMSMVMAGLILLQASWIKSSINIREQHFDELVNNVLADLAFDIERQETAANIMGELNLSDPNVYDSTLLPIDLQHNIYISNDNPNGEFKANISVFKNDTLILQQQFSDSSNLENISDVNSTNSKLLSQRQKMVNTILDKLFNFNPRIEERVNPQELENYLRTVFNERGIKLPFEYSITKWNTVPVFQSDKFDMDEKNEIYKVRLFQNDYYSERNYLYLYFPKKQNFLIRSLGFMSFSTLFLTILLVFSFGFTVYIIFKQKRLSEIRNDFISNMTHELKTPISTISLASQMLGDKSIPVEAKNINYLSNMITEESKKLGFHVEKVLQLAVFEKGNLELKFKETDIHDIISNVIKTFGIQIKNKNGRIIPALQADYHILEIDQVHFTNVISNLIDNAIKYTNQDPEIYVETQNENNFLTITVKDNGIGISKPDIKKIFEKFYRVSTGNIHTVKGFGLGLSYVKKIVEEHKGFIKVDSELYEGTTFKIFLPLIK